MLLVPRPDELKAPLQAEPTGSSSNALIDVRLLSIRFGARDTNLYELGRLDGGRLPAVVAGSHIDVHLPNGITRQYSLILPEQEPRSYLIGVKRDQQSRGGSSYLHENIRVGTPLKISAPRNNFPLVEDAPHTLLIAGGIGITPIWCMWQRLTSISRSVELVYSCRSRADAVFLSDLESADGVTLRFDDENSGSVLDIANLVSRAPKGTHAFCCGPGPMLDAFEKATIGWSPELVHVEYFTSQVEAANEGGFTVELSRSGKEVVIAPGETILAALIRAGVDAPYSCEEGVCGACMTTVLSGVPDHRDSVLTDEERSKNTKIMICCSGSKTRRLVLDL